MQKEDKWILSFPLGFPDLASTLDMGMRPHQGWSGVGETNRNPSCLVEWVEARPALPYPKPYVEEKETLI